MASYEYDSQNQELHRIAGGTLFADCPIGSYIPFGGTAIPTGWLLCNGQAVSRTDYADLFAVIGTAYGSGDGSTTFNIPDLREAVPKGAGLTGKSNNHLDADGLAVGEFLDDRIQDHKHKIYYQGVAIGSGFYAYSVDTQSQTGSTREVQTDTRTGATTEVKAVGSNYIIKAKQIGVPADFASAIEDVIDDKRHYYHTTFQGSTTNGWNYTDIAFDKTFKYPPLVSITIASVGYISSAITYWQDTLSPFYAVEVDKMRIAYFVKDNTQITYDVNVIGELATN